jgi:hypothetical protein
MSDENSCDVRDGVVLARLKNPNLHAEIAKARAVRGLREDRGSGDDQGSGNG